MGKANESAIIDTHAVHMRVTQADKSKMTAMGVHFVLMIPQ